MIDRDAFVGPTSTDSYDKVWAYLMAALRQCADTGIAQREVLPPMIDFVALTGLTIGGEQAVRVAIRRLEQWIEDWNKGRCSKLDNATDFG